MNILPIEESKTILHKCPKCIDGWVIRYYSFSKKNMYSQPIQGICITCNGKGLIPEDEFLVLKLQGKI